MDNNGQYIISSSQNMYSPASPGGVPVKRSHVGDVNVQEGETGAGGGVGGGAAVESGCIPATINAAVASSAHKALSTSSKKAKIDSSASCEEEQKQASVCIDINDRITSLRYNQPIVSKLSPLSQKETLMASGLSEEAAEMAIRVMRQQKLEHQHKTGNVAILFHPFKENPDNVTVISKTPDVSSVKFLKYRIDDNYLFVIDSIPFVKDGKNVSFTGWALRRVRRGEADTREYIDITDGKKKNRFTFSGVLSILPEFHLALRMLSMSCKVTPMMSVEEIGDLRADKFGIIDLSSACHTVYTERVFAFGAFRLYIREQSFEGGNKQPVFYYSLILAKEKSEKSKQESRARGEDESKEFFTIQIPVRRMPHLLLAIERSMLENEITSLPLPEDFLASIDKTQIPTERKNEIV